MPHLQVVIASTRSARLGPFVANWFMQCAQAHDRFELELVDLAEVNLPLLDEPAHPRLKQYVHEHTKAWSARVERADAFVFVTPEYNYSAPPALVNALDYLHHEWHYKPVGLVSYGGVSAGTRGAQVTKQICTALKMMPMFEAVSIPFFAQFVDKEKGTFTPGKTQDDAARVMLDELLRWTEAMKSLRAK